MSVMDYATTEHFYKWLEKSVLPEDQSPVEDAIHALMRANPGEYPGKRSWPDVRRHAEHECEHDWMLDVEAFGASDLKYCRKCARYEGASIL